MKLQSMRKNDRSFIKDIRNPRLSEILSTKERRQRQSSLKEIEWKAKSKSKRAHNANVKQNIPCIKTKAKVLKDMIVKKMVMKFQTSTLNQSDLEQHIDSAKIDCFLKNRTKLLSTKELKTHLNPQRKDATLLRKQERFRNLKETHGQHRRSINQLEEGLRKINHSKSQKFQNSINKDMSFGDIVPSLRIKHSKQMGKILTSKRNFSKKLRTISTFKMDQLKNTEILSSTVQETQLNRLITALSNQQSIKRSSKLDKLYERCENILHSQRAQTQLLLRRNEELQVQNEYLKLQLKIQKDHCHNIGNQFI